MPTSQLIFLWQPCLLPVLSTCRRGSAARLPWPTNIQLCSAFPHCQPQHAWLDSPPLLLLLLLHGSILLLLVPWRPGWEEQERSFFSHSSAAASRTPPSIPRKQVSQSQRPQFFFLHGLQQGRPHSSHEGKKKLPEVVSVEDSPFFFPYFHYLPLDQEIARPLSPTLVCRGSLRPSPSPRSGASSSDVLFFPLPYRTLRRPLLQSPPPPPLLRLLAPAGAAAAPLPPAPPPPSSDPPSASPPSHEKELLCDSCTVQKLRSTVEISSFLPSLVVLVRCDIAARRILLDDSSC